MWNQFEHKSFIWLLACVGIMVLLLFASLQWKKQVKKRIGDERLVNNLITTYSPKLSLIKFIVIGLAFVIGVIAAMNPRQPAGDAGVKRKGIDIAIALDVSKSMLAADLAPNRLERAKQFIGKMMVAMPDDRVALILFAGKAYLQMPLTVDHGAAQLFVNAAGPEAVPQQGTVISEALEKSAYALSGSENKFKIVVLISDGEDHDADAVNTAEKLAEQGVMINTIGIGSTEGTTITDPVTGEIKIDESGSPVISKLNEEILTDIAAKTKGIYTHLTSSDEAVNLLNKQLSGIDRIAFSDISQGNFKTWITWLAAAMFILLMAEIFIPEVRNALDLKRITT